MLSFVYTMNQNITSVTNLYRGDTALHSAYIKSTITKFCFWSLRFQNIPRSNITRVEMFHDQHPWTVTVVRHCIRHQCFVLLPNVWVVLKTCFTILHNIVARNNVQHSMKQAKGKEKSFLHICTTSGLF